jgi:YHS domain-containing protein
MKTIAVLLMFALNIESNAQVENLRKAHFNTQKNVAIEGYDPVSYFEGEPVEGRETLTSTHKGIVYHFATQNNMAKFNINAEKYEPAYGGWCAYAMGASGEKVKIDPETYKIVNGRLYLFYNYWGNNTLKLWNQSEKNLQESADKFWTNLYK